MSLMISPGMRGAGGAAGVDGAAALAGAGSAGRGAAADSSGRGRGAGAGVPAVADGFAATGAFLNIGAGCEPFCMTRTLIRIAMVAKAPMVKPTASRELHPST